MAAFSSRGPNPITPEILKQNFIAPGVNIIAGLTGKFGPSGLKVDTRHVEFNIVSGTSMSCPHASGLATLVKSAHPEWSPASIKSALMTTAYNTYKNGKTIQDIATGMPSAPFDHGAGQYNLGDFNYPSFVVPFETALGKDGGNIAPAVIKYTRTLTNVGILTAYKVSASSETSSVKITVEPETLAFSRPNEKKNYTLTFTATSLPSGTTSFARI